eukprot:CAMPEP_0181208430 /NCGR_PEP_ID=MMETSP1096-20121128/22112_1 /TAXON_ID=156174 ORGANISM="Chrysochromulina ericina, Strain CCMP281" /NCGR_SAMPLE_ID=MMETSP1096 /ASSEMBLY_ACC=CAM_ASM_000453 /LENGTH=62 /DNA_ID=CAMNT_0023299491 /DNA_START=481 /DNA_END=666 /DNA_ORIENTATION=-
MSNSLRERDLASLPPAATPLGTSCCPMSSLSSPVSAEDRVSVVDAVDIHASRSSEMICSPVW